MQSSCLSLNKWPTFLWAFILNTQLDRQMLIGVGVSTALCWDSSKITTISILNLSQYHTTARMETEELSVFDSTYTPSVGFTLWASFVCTHLDQVALRREAKAVDGVGSAVGPLAKLLWCLGERHVGGDGAVDNGLWRTKHMTEPHHSMWNSKREITTVYCLLKHHWLGEQLP